MIEIDPRYFRPTEVDMLLGDSTKAQTKIGWKPTVDFATLVRSMVDADEALARDEEHLVRINGGNSRRPKS
jgi:GDPmannose 4,6-dehydratase